MALGRRYPVLLNLCTGQVGSFLGTVKAEEDTVRIEFYPFNSLKRVVSEEAYPVESIVKTMSPDSRKPGAFKEYVVITESIRGDSPFLDSVNSNLLKRIKKYKEMEQEKEFELAQQKHRSRKLREETKKQVAEDMELVRARRTSIDDGGGIFPRDRFRDYLPGDENY